MIANSIGPNFEPVLTGYLTPETRQEDIERGYRSRSWHAMKAYPPGATTHSNEGVSGKDLIVHPALSVMEALGMPLLLHGEVNFDNAEVDPYDREQHFLTDVLGEIYTRFPRLKISLEHITTAEAASWMIRYGNERMVCTITAHHLLLDRRDYFRGGPNNHLHCWPVLKRSEDREALRDLIRHRAPFVVAGSDSAPHPTTAKERACGCAGGVFTAHALVPLYARIFSEMQALHLLEEFLCIRGPRFLGLSPKPGRMILSQTPWTMDGMVQVEDGARVRPFGYHENPKERFVFNWRIESFEH